MRDAISLRALTPDDWEIFRSARLNALKQHREVYLSSYEAEPETPEVKWKETLNGNGKCVVALFDNDRLIGFAAVFTWRGDPTGKQRIARHKMSRAAAVQTVRVQTKHAGVLLRKLQRAQRRKSGESRLCKHTAGESSGSANKANRRLDSKPGSPCGKANFAASSISHIQNLCVQIEVFLAGEQHVGGHASLRRCIVSKLYL